MRVMPTALEGVMVIQPKRFTDSRGFFLESWNAEAFAAAGLPTTFAQDNHSRSVKYTLRGLHYQVRTPQGKLVRCTYGEIFDVVVDLRRLSPTFGRWISVVLSADNQQMLWLPPGLAHGFLVASAFAEMQYKVTTPYSAPDDRAIRWNDPILAIRWPLPSGIVPLQSAKDAAAPLFAEIDRDELGLPGATITSSENAP